MKNIITLLFIMTFISTSAQDGKATTQKKTFSRSTRIQTIIDAQPETIWALLTDAAHYPSWNSTIISIDGTIAKGEKIKLKSTLDSSRTFNLKVKEMQKHEKLIWGDAMGKRIYTLTKVKNGTLFSMKEKIGGPLFPLFAKKIPPFDASFEQFTADLKKAAERK